ncbi:hypothetical protein AAFF_G00122190 [Aldrovandia affinis]|uniref:Uncharacterized protein n=1 Tax=Aldrovandia affinis TaxID=143900 RepID=A0AAD7RRT9_9TELE|nr:hypothetical protein AAFF_G00122190 [Aldrovandia affinis]
MTPFATETERLLSLVHYDGLSGCAGASNTLPHGHLSLYPGQITLGYFSMPAQWPFKDDGDFRHRDVAVALQGGRVCVKATRQPLPLSSAWPLPRWPLWGRISCQTDACLSHSDIRTICRHSAESRETMSAPPGPGAPLNLTTVGGDKLYWKRLIHTLEQRLNRTQTMELIHTLEQCLNRTQTMELIHTLEQCLNRTQTMELIHTLEQCLNRMQTVGLIHTLEQCLNRMQTVGLIHTLEQRLNRTQTMELIHTLEQRLNRTQTMGLIHTLEQCLNRTQTVGLIHTLEQRLNRTQTGWSSSTH